MIGRRLQRVSPAGTDIIQFRGHRVKPGLRGWDVVECRRFRR
jgi:hypothetical protein